MRLFLVGLFSLVGLCLVVGDLLRGVLTSVCFVCVCLLNVFIFVSLVFGFDLVWFSWSCLCILVVL